MLKKKIAFILLLILILSVVCSLISCGSSGKDKDPSHYTYSSCTHCGGSGKNKSGGTCGWCNGTGVYAVKKDEYK